ncbi:MAG: hypothetical protein NC548_26440 [Lachnospiraceae bacterium]|nr:hypothetical protein [Lachnospiraceae bacterium]
MAGNRRRRARKKKKLETSKALLYFSDIITGICTVTAVIAVFALEDTSPLTFLIPAAYGLSATSHGFYYWKAKAENLKKFGRTDEITENGGDFLD